MTAAALTIQRHDDGSLSVVGDVPDLIFIADELLNARTDGLDVYGSNVVFYTSPPLRYVLHGLSPTHAPHKVWVAEKVTEFPA